MSALPRASTEQILNAVTELEAEGPVTVGQVGMEVAGMLGVDMTQVATVYQLRSLISWQSLQTSLRELTAQGALVRRTQEDWHRVSDGRLFRHAASATGWAYCTPAGASEVRKRTLVDRMYLVNADQEEAERLAKRYPQAARYAREHFVERHPRLFSEMILQWVRDQENGI